MKYLALVLALTASVAQAITFSSLAAVSLTLISLNKPATGFFGFFRRRSPMQTLIEESTAPEGPVEFPASSFQESGNFFNRFPSGNGFFPGFLNVPAFPGGMFQANRFLQRPPVQSWMPSQQQPQSVQFQPIPAAVQSGSQPSFERDGRFEEQPMINTEEAESFFTLLAETDENKCISRLVCELGADSSSAGELGSTISEIIGSLTDFPSGSKVSEYNHILQRGQSEGISSCASHFTTCDEESYGLMKNSQAEESTEKE